LYLLSLTRLGQGDDYVTYFPLATNRAGFMCGFGLSILWRDCPGRILGKRGNDLILRNSNVREEIMLELIVSVCFFVLGLFAFTGFLANDFKARRLDELSIQLTREGLKSAILGAALMVAAMLML